MMNWTSMDSPIGPLLLASEQGKLVDIEFGADEAAVQRLLAWAKAHYPTSTVTEVAPGEDAVLDEAVRELQQYFAGKLRTFTVPLELRGTPFQMRVWEALQAIPYGETRSYKEIARAIGSPQAMRAVGGANNKNPIAIIVPCHRVIGAGGAMVGYGGGLPVKEKLLQLEGL